MVTTVPQNLIESMALGTSSWVCARKCYVTGKYGIPGPTDMLHYNKWLNDNQNMYITKAAS